MHFLDAKSNRMDILMLYYFTVLWDRQCFSCESILSIVNDIEGHYLYFIPSPPKISQIYACFRTASFKKNLYNTKYTILRLLEFNEGKVLVVYSPFYVR